MLDIMAGMDQKNSLEVHRCSSWTRFSTCPLLCYVWCHGPDSAVHCLAVPQLLFITVVDTPFRCAVAVPHGPVCSENHRDSPVRIWWSMSLFAGSPQVQSWMDCSDSQLQPVDARPRCAGLQVPQVRSVRRQSRSHCCCFTPDLQYIDMVVDVPVVLRMPVVVQQQVP